ncbi:arsenite methyltransferase [Actinocatenispora comari]|jgi:SAM-dependent methyltransferase|uniref:Arsenite methyltransferase n=1 Tax=Actinocatenispora comari TaxID=2807577 RepID=A0A8J4ELL6_9ACTN|nr:arsenite methyltransferase [Actinocatenispora comari]GIL27923.1 arsenite S-adenosylmethyltransferase [Actinocatenispora comari]
MTQDQSTGNALRDEVRARYAEAARRITAAAPAAGRCGPADNATVLATIDANADCCGGGSCGTGEADPFGAGRYDQADRDQLPADAVTASLGCGNPLAVAELDAGETVLDLGSGGGIDVLLSAKRVGPTGRAYGLDMTDDMLALARSNAARAGATNVEFLQGEIENIPLPDAAVDVIISNCVINLSTDKPAVLAEAFRVLRPGGRIGVSDVVAEDRLSPAERAERGQWVGCIAGALSVTEYHDGLAAAGFTDIEITPTQQAADGMHAAIVRARKPA